MTKRESKQSAGRRSVAERAIEAVVLGLLQLLNPMMKRALRSRLHGLFSRWFLLLSFTGRKSGRRIETPVSYFVAEDALVLTTKRPWWRNVAEEGSVDATVRGHRSRRQVEVTKGVEIADRLAGAPRWFQVLAALDDGVLGRLSRAQIERSAQEGRVVLALRRGSAPEAAGRA